MEHAPVSPHLPRGAATRHRTVTLPPVHAVDLMTREGSALFGAQWKTREAKRSSREAG